MSPIGLYGGSFDPIHRGHVEPVREARRILGLDRVVYLPTAQPPHKKRRLAPAWARFAMVELALLGDPDLLVSPFEMSGDRPSYTVDTVTHFATSAPKTRWVLLIGADSWASFTRWRDWPRIIATVDLAVLLRPGEKFDPTVPLEDPFEQLRRSGQLHFVPNSPLDISSTVLRRRLARGERPADEMSPLVLDYIHKYRLYEKDTNLADDDPSR